MKCAENVRKCPGAIYDIVESAKKIRCSLEGNQSSGAFLMGKIGGDGYAVQTQGSLQASGLPEPRFRRAEVLRGT